MYNFARCQGGVCLPAMFGGVLLAVKEAQGTCRAREDARGHVIDDLDRLRGWQGNSFLNGILEHT